jgi:hypothetical protein
MCLARHVLSFGPRRLTRRLLSLKLSERARSCNMLRLPLIEALNEHTAGETQERAFSRRSGVHIVPYCVITPAWLTDQ